MTTKLRMAVPLLTMMLHEDVPRGQILGRLQVKGRELLPAEWMECLRQTRSRASHRLVLKRRRPKATCQKNVYLGIVTNTWLRTSSFEKLRERKVELCDRPFSFTN
jgi:hypothetical protein